MTRAITSELLRRLPATPGDIRDTRLRGFVLRVRAGGRGSFLVALGRGRWHTIGPVDAITLSDAREEARRLLAEKALGRELPTGRTLTLSAFLERVYEPWVTSNRRTGAETIDRIKASFPDLVKTDLSAITAWSLEKWRGSRLREGKAPATVNRDLAALRAALSFAVRSKHLTRHPMTEVKAAKLDRSAVVRFLSPEEETRLRKALAARDDRRREERERANVWRRERGYEEWPQYSTYSDHLTPLVLLALNTGLRRGELFGLRWRDVDLKLADVVVRGVEAKSGHTRHIPLNEEAVKVLKAWKPKDAEADGYVFPGREPGAPLDDIKTAWLALVKAAKVQAFRFHDCRHTFASKLVQAGVDLNTVRELLGHTDLKMTLRYAHLAPEHKAAAVAKLISATR